MKRNLLIGTSLVAAFASTSLDARSFSVMTEEARADNTALAAADHIVRVGHATATATGKKALKAGESDAFATIYNAVAAQLLAERTEAAKDGKVAPVTLADVTTALATNQALLKLVKDHRKTVVAQVAKNSVVAPVVAPVDQVVGPVAPVGPTTEEVTVATLTKAISEAKEAATKAIRDEAAANAELEGAVATLTTATTDLEAADTALTAAKTAQAEAATKASEAKAALTAAEEDLKNLNTKKKELEATVENATSAAEGKAEGSKEALALNTLNKEIELFDTKIQQAELNKAEADTKLAAAETAKTEAETAATDAKTDHETAVKKLADANTTKAEAETKATAAKTAQVEAITKLEAAKKVALEAAQAAATKAAIEATAAQDAANAAELKKTELETAAQSAKNKFIDLGKRQTSLNTELNAARAADAANSTADTQAAVKTKEAAVIAIATELAQAKIDAKHADQAATKATEAAAKAAADSVKATEAKVTADNELKDSQDLAKSSDEVITALKAEILAALNAEQAAAKNADAKDAANAANTEADDATKADAAAREELAHKAQVSADVKAKVSELEAQIKVLTDAGKTVDPTLTAELKSAKDDQAAADAAANAAKADAEAKAVALLAAQNKQAAAEQAAETAAANARDLDAKLVAETAARRDAEVAASAAVEEARDLAAHLEAETAARRDAEAAESAAVEKALDLAAQLNAETAAKKAADEKASGLTTQLNAVDFDKVLESTIDDLKTQLKDADATDTIEIARLQANLDSATELAELIPTNVTGTDDKLSAEIARQINARINRGKVSFLPDLKGAKDLTDVIVENKEALLNLGDLVNIFNEVKDLIDADVTEESEGASSDDRRRNELVRNLQAMFEVKLVDVIKARQELRAGTALIRAQGVAEIASLKTLEAALDAVEENQNVEVFKLVRGIYSPNQYERYYGGLLSREDERSHAREEVKVQNLTAETIAELHGALKDYLTYLNSVAGSEIDLLSVDSKSKFQGILASCGLENVSITEALSKLERRENPSVDRTILTDLSNLIIEANQARSIMLSDRCTNHNLAVEAINNAVEAILSPAPEAPSEESSAAGDEESSSAPRAASQLGSVSRLRAKFKPALAGDLPLRRGAAAAASDDDSDDNGSSASHRSAATPCGDDAGAAGQGHQIDGEFTSERPVAGGSHPSTVNVPAPQGSRATAGAENGHRMTEAEIRKAETQRVADARLVSGKAPHSDAAAASDDDSEASAASLPVRQPGESDDQQRDGESTADYAARRAIIAEARARASAEIDLDA